MKVTGRLTRVCRISQRFRPAGLKITVTGLTGSIVAFKVIVVGQASMPVPPRFCASQLFSLYEVLRA